MQTLLQDLRYALRMLRKNPGFTAVAVLTLALGIGANTAIFTFINALILRSLPVQDPQALVLFGPGDDRGTITGFPADDMTLFSYPMYREFQQKNQVFSGVAAILSYDARGHGTVAHSSNIEPLEIQLVSGTYFNMLGVKPALGRVLTDADDQTSGGHPVAVISYAWWTSRFSRDGSVLGKTVNLGSSLCTIVGVAASGFSGVSVGDAPDLWIPLQMHDRILRGPQLNDPFCRAENVIARLRPGVNLAQAGANVNVVLKQILHEYANARPVPEAVRVGGNKLEEDIQKAHVTVNPAATGISPGLRDLFERPLWMLMAIVGLVLLIACANIANLLLARGTNRQREIAVRMALGAGRARLVRQLLTESLLLAGVGGALGVFFASWVSQFLLVTISDGPSGGGPFGGGLGKITLLDISPDARVLGFTLLATVGTAALFGILPALRATRVQVAPLLKEGRGAMAAQSRTLLAKALIVSQVALSLVLLLGAGLFVRSLMNLVNVNTGFDRNGVLVFYVDSSAMGYADEPRLGNLYRQVEARVEALPGVRAASFSIFTFGPGGWRTTAWAEDYPDAPRQVAWYNAVGPGYFAVMGLPLLAGRDFTPGDTSASPRVAVINETMARKFFPGGSAVGKRFGMKSKDHSHDIQVVGVVRDAKYESLDEKPKAMAYYPYAQYTPDWGTGLFLGDFEVRFSGDSQATTAEVRRAIGDINASLAIWDVWTLARNVDNSIRYPRLIAQFSSFFGLLAAFLACFGIYGVMSYAVGRRTSEIGLRMALGARRSDVVGMVLREIVLLLAIGLAIGIPVALGADRWVASLLFGLKPSDPTTISMAVVLLVLVAGLAAYLPARRASKVDPIVALRYE
jgi:predicted permease